VSEADQSSDTVETEERERASTTPLDLSSLDGSDAA